MTATDTSTREIYNTRTYPASKELLLRMWGNPEHLNNWWGPHGFTTTTHEMDFSNGGYWRFTMHGPDGRDYPNIIRYKSISTDGIEYDHMCEDGSINFQASIEFVEVGTGTEMRFRMTCPTAEDRQAKCDAGAVEGLANTLERLDILVAKQNPESFELVIVRKFKVSIERVWQALSDEKQVSQWVCPMGLECERESEPLSVGGKWRMKMIIPEGPSFTAEGEYTRIEPNHLLEFTHRWEKEDGTFKPTTTVRFALTECDGETTMVFVQSGLWSTGSVAAHRGGWDSTMHKLGVLVGGTMADQTVCLEREFHAPIELVWKCWTEPEHFAAWFAPRPYTVPRCEIDLQPGGQVLLVMRSPDGMEFPMHSQITDIEPHQSFGWVNTVTGQDGNMAIQGGTTVLFEDLGGSTKVQVFAYNAAYSEQGKMMIGGMEPGWNMSLDQLGEYTAGRGDKS